MKRIDKIISEQTNYSRKQIKNLISSKAILVNNQIIMRPEQKFDENNIIITINNQPIKIINHFYLLLNKPKGFVSSTEKGNEKTVLDLISDNYKTKNLFPAGRLDKDTTGLMLITDDGEFAHNILSPKKHIKKQYEVTLNLPITDKMVEEFFNGVQLNDGKCKSALLEKTGEFTARVTLTEGRYHQIKRMFGCYKAKVLQLHRIGMGNLALPNNLKPGEFKEANQEELNKIQEK